MTDLNEIFEYCIKCSICQSVCPVAAYDAGFPGPKILGPDLARLQAAGEAGKNRTAELLPLLGMCSSCLRCETACPFDIPVARLIRRAEQSSRETPPTSLFFQGAFRRLRDKMLAHPEKLGRIGTALAPLANKLMGDSAVQKLLSRALGLEMEQPNNFASWKQCRRFILELSSSDNQRIAQPPAISPGSELSRASRAPSTELAGPVISPGSEQDSSDIQQADKRTEAKSFEVFLGGSDKNNHEDSAENTPRYYADHRVENRPGDGIKNMADKTACTPDVNHLRADNKVLYFTGCHVNFYQPEIGTAFLQLLKKLGIKPVIYNSHCCGIPLLANGDRTGAHRAFLRNIQLLKPYVDQGYQLVCTCPTCSLALKKFYAEELETKVAEQLAAATYDYAEYLENYICELKGLIHPVEDSFIFHLPCHTQAQGVSAANLNLLRLIPGLKLGIVDKCCGQSGTYGYKTEKREVSRGISASLARQIKEQSNELDTKTVLTPCSSCGYRITLECGVRAEHPLLLIWEAAVK